MTQVSTTERERARQLAAEGMALFEGGQAADALERWQEAAQLDEGNALAITGLGMCAVAAGRVDKALPLFVRAVELDPLSALPHVNLGQALLAGGDAQKAMDSFISARDIEPDAPDAHLGIARALAASGHTQEAANALEWTLARFPPQEHGQSAGLTRHLGDLLHDLGQAEAARDAYLRALDENPDDADAICHLAVLGWEAGDDAHARLLARQALAVRPEHEEARALLAKLGPA